MSCSSCARETGTEPQTVQSPSMRITTAILGLLFSCVAVAQQNDWVMEPGIRLGPLTAETSRAALVRLFGKTNVNDQDVDTGEGPEPATIVFARDSSAKLAILWHDNRIDRVLVCFDSEFGPCKWHTKDGVTLGTGLPKLEELNGRPFAIEAWGSDVGGNITSWRGGGLATEFGDGGRFHLLLSLAWHRPPSGPTPEQKRAEDEMDRLGGRRLSSDSPVRKLHPEVAHMTLIFPQP
jgi:hypothetical protein